MSTLPERVSVVIVGGGFAGASTAHALAEAGITDTLIVEREVTCGVHASGRNAALCRQVTEHDAFTELATRGAAFLRSPPPGFADAPLLRRTGSILLCDTDAQIDRLAARADRFDVPHERITSAGAAARWPLLAGAPSAGGILFPTDGVIDVHGLLQGYLSGARAAGARVMVGCEALALRRSEERGVTVVTSRGPVRAAVAVIAAGAWADEVGQRFGAPQRALSAVLRHLFITEPVALTSPDVPYVWHLGAGEFYARPEGDGLLLSGCDETVVEPCDARPLDGAFEALAERLTRAAPGFVDLGIARSWACLRTFTPEQTPVIEWDPTHPWLFWVAGLGGHGATSSPAVGTSAAAKIAARLAPRLA